MLESLIKFASDAIREFSDMERLFAADNQDSRTVVFYAEREIHYWYFAGYIEAILAESDLDICYISSDSNDPIFQISNPRIKPFYIRNLLSTVFSRLDSKVLVMTNPGINRCSIRRAPHPVNHVYVFHGIASIHKGYKHGAFDFYDTVFCLAPYQVAELRRTEEIYGLPPKELIVTGYPLLETIYQQYQIYQQKRTARYLPVCLIAPTWGPSSLMEHCIDEMITVLEHMELEVQIRPHPEFVKQEPQKMRKLTQRLKQCPNISLQLDLAPLESLYEADILITEHSSICYEYALGTQRPVLFIDTPMRVDNPEWEKLGLEPMENLYRCQLGACLSPDNIGQVGLMVDSLLKQSNKFQKVLPEIREKMVANWQHSAAIGASHILQLCGR